MSANGMLRAGIIGAGWIGERHAETLAGRDDVAVTAVCDTDAGRAAAVAALSGAEVFADWRQLLETAALDVLWVCTPPRVHAGPAIAALDRGLPLYLEKPIARSPGDARAIADAAARSGTVCAVGYQWHAVEVIDDLRLALAGLCGAGGGSGVVARFGGRFGSFGLARTLVTWLSRSWARSAPVSSPNWMLPDVGRSRPPSIWSSVVLPCPVLPWTASHSPVLIAKSSSRTARISRPLLR